MSRKQSTESILTGSIEIPVTSSTAPASKMMTEQNCTKPGLFKCISVMVHVRAQPPRALYNNIQ